MLSFRVKGIPVTVEPMFWLSLVLLGAGRLDQGIAPLAIWVAVGFVSVLWHELGHGLFQRKYGGEPKIYLIAFGGLASSPGYFTQRQQIVIALAGPVFQLIIAGLLWRAQVHAPRLFSADAGLLGQVLTDLFFINLWWAVLNLAPILPLDGGRVVAALLPRQIKAVHGLGILVAGAIAVWGLMQGRLFLTVMFAFFAFDNFRALSRPTAVPPPPPPPL